MLGKAIALGLTVASLSSFSAPTYAQDYMQQRDTLINQGYQDIYRQTYDPAGRRWNPYDAQAGQNQGQQETQLERCKRLHNCDTRYDWCRKHRQMVGCGGYNY